MHKLRPHQSSPQRERVNAFCEARTSAIHGQGLFATRRMRKGMRVIEYLGERIDKEESNRRGLELFEQAKETGGASVYIFDVNEDWDLDGDKPYNPARLINHSCEPNCEMVNEDDRLYLYALRDIEKGEELSFDYGYDIEHYMDHPCRCGTPSCVGYIVNSAQRPKLRRMLKRKEKERSLVKGKKG